MRSRKRFLLPILLCLVGLVSPCHAQTAADPNQRTVEVAGHGDANAKPDAMIVSFAVNNQAPTADECTRAHAEKVRQVIDALKAKLGTDTKIETSEYSLNPNVTYINVPAAPPEPPKTMWDFKAIVSAESDSLEMMGPLIDAAMAAGASRLQQSGVNDIPDDEDSAPSYFWHRKHRRRMKRVTFVNLEVEAQGTSATDAARKGAPKIAQVEKVLQQQLGEHGAVKLIEFNIGQLDSNQYRYQQPPQPQVQSQQVQNFAAHTTMTAETSKLDMLGPVVQAGLDSGASRLNQVQFTLHDDSQARKDAIEKASAEAKTKADSVAKSMGVRLGKILRISTNAQVRPQVIYGNSYQISAMASSTLHRSQQAAVPVLPHEVGFSADVTVVYEIE